jgi:hypothetical protein
MFFSFAAVFVKLGNCRSGKIPTAACGGIRRAVALIAISLGVLVAASEKVLAQAQVTGQWVTLPYLMSINPVRVDLLRNGKVLIVAGSENDPNKHLQGSSKAAVWDLAAHTITVQQMLWDVFCNGGTFFADGRCMVVGGTVQYDPFYGDPRITVFDPLTNKFNQLHSMAHGRWYATAITLGDGRVLAFSGTDETGATNQNRRNLQGRIWVESPLQRRLDSALIPLATSPAERHYLLFGRFTEFADLQSV